MLDGDLLADVTGDESYKGKLIDFAPILAFATFEETRHTGAALARWKAASHARWGLKGAIGLATEDGASNNKAANKILKQPSTVCWPHDLARAVLFASGDAGKMSKNPELKAWSGRAGKQSAAFHRSGVANKALQEAQLEANPELKANRVLSTKVKNTTRWLGLYLMCHHNRLIGPEIRIALTGNDNGLCEEEAAMPAPRATRETSAYDSSSEESEASDSSGDDQEEGNRATGKKFPLAHRAMAGHKELRPGGEGEPAPWEAVLAVAEFLAIPGYPEETVAVLVSADTALREEGPLMEVDEAPVVVEDAPDAA